MLPKANVHGTLLIYFHENIRDFWKGKNTKYSIEELNH